MKRTWAVIPLVVMGIPAIAASATLNVASTGTDGPACGPVASPCRSITRAITNATAGDKILVGPGLYSPNLDNDAVFNEPGEEPGSGITINKPVQLLSKLGASSTFIRGTVRLEVSDAVLGKLGSGFTIATAGNPLLVGVGSVIANFRVGGNVIVVDGPDGPAGIVAVNTRGRFENNRVVSPQACSAGFFMVNTGDLLERNVVMGCTVGFSLQSNANSRLVRNAAIGNIVTSAVANGIGFLVSDGTVAEFTGNAAIGNVTGLSAGAPIVKLEKNAFVANTSNCGIRNFSGGTLDATNNYWGSPTGPGADPADQACDGPTTTTPFLTSDPTRAQSALR